MPRTIKADGRTITVPDDATPDEINQIVGPAPKAASASTDPSGRTPTGEPAPGDTRNGFQRWADNLITPDPRREEWQSPLRSGVDDFAQHVASSVVPLVSHPINSAEGMASTVGHAIANNPGNAAGVMSDLARPLIEHAAEDYQAHGPVRGTTDLVGTGAGMAASGELGGVGGKLLGRGAEAISEPMQAGGGGLIDRAAGSLKGDFAHEAQPGRAYLEGGGTPALTMRGLANKAEAVKETAGQHLGEAYDAASRPAGQVMSPEPSGTPFPLGATRIPAGDVRSALLDPVNRLRGIQNGPGGVGASPALDDYEGGIRSSTGEDFTPRSLFDLKRNVAANTRWNDPTMFDMNSVRQQGVGGVGKLLTDAVPETGPLNRIYQGSGNLAERAGARADTGTPPFTSLVNRGLEGAAGVGLGYATHNPFLAAAPLLMDSIPVKTSAGYLLYHAGRLAGAAPNLAPVGTAAGVAAPLLRPQENQ